MLHSSPMWRFRLNLSLSVLKFSQKKNTTRCFDHELETPTNSPFSKNLLATQWSNAKKSAKKFDHTPPNLRKLFVNQFQFSSLIYHPSTLSMAPIPPKCRDLNCEVFPSYLQQRITNKIDSSTNLVTKHTLIHTCTLRSVI